MSGLQIAARVAMTTPVADHLTEHLTDHEVAAFVGGAAGPDLMDRVDAHVDGCAACRALVAGSLGLAETGAAEASEDGGATDGVAFAPGAHVGRYRVGRLLGRGGAGAVYAARDLTLDRDVALKVLHPLPGLDTDEPAAAERLRREARAMARVAHPNVVDVYEVGRHAGRLFIAMAYVAGDDLGGWLAVAPRDWRAVVRLFIAAGRGLAAAHDHGFVHRDFKPANVLVDRDDRPHVSDFGLVRAAEAAGAGGGHELTSALAGDPADLGDLTLTGTVLGTPRYMSPEQFRGAPAGPAADQYSFCVALYEALFGSPPFDGDSFVALRARVLTGARPRPDTTRGVPAAIVRAVVRGLAVDPAARHPSMAALLAVLERALGRRRRWRLAGLMAAGVVAAVAGGIGVGLSSAPELPALPTRPSPAPDPCGDMGRHFASMWGEERRARFEDGLARTWPAEPGPGLHPKLAERWDRLGGVYAKLASSRVDHFGAAWTEARTEACRAARVEGRESPRQLELRLLCLEKWRLEADRVIQTGVDAERTAVWARSSVDELKARLSDCEAEVVSGMPALPIGSRSGWEAAQRTLTAVRGQRDRGAIADAIVAARAATAEARALAYAPTLAEALALEADVVTQGRGDEAAAPILFEAYTTATSARHDGLAGDVAARLAWSALRRRDNEKADEWAHIAKASYDRAGRGPGFYVWLASVRSFAAHERGRLDEGLALARQAVADAQAAKLSTVDVATLMGNVGLMYGSVGERAEGRRVLAEALRLAEGAGDPDTIALIHRHRAQLGEPEELAPPP